MSADRKIRTISSLNDPQRRNLHNACKYMDSLLKDIEATLDPDRTDSAFPKYIHDIAPIQRNAINQFIARFRAQLLHVLADQEIEVEQPRIKASHAIHTALTFIEIAIEELSPGRMQGYGPVSDAGAADLQTIIQNLQSVVHEVHRSVLPSGATLHSETGSQAVIIENSIVPGCRDRR